MIFSLGLTSRRELVIHSGEQKEKMASLLEKFSINCFLFQISLKTTKLLKVTQFSKKIINRTAHNLPTVSPQKIQVDNKQKASSGSSFNHDRPKQMPLETFLPQV